MRVGLLNLLRRLGADGPFAIVVDDLQWVDPPTADALGFAFRRLTAPGSALVLARRPGPATPLEDALRGTAIETIGLPGLSSGDLRAIVADRLGLRLSGPLMNRIARAAQGNPLVALELGRAVRDRGVPAFDAFLPTTDALAATLEQRVDALPGDLRRVLALVALGGSVEETALAAIVTPDVLYNAQAAELIRIRAGWVEATHPLLSETASRLLQPKERRRLHLALADVIDDPVLRALHRAEGTVRRDAGGAAEAGAAGALSRSRGDARSALRLADHALRLSPVDDPLRPARVLDLATLLASVAERGRLRDLLDGELPTLPPGNLKGQAYMLLSDTVSRPEADHVFDMALAEFADDPAGRADALAWKSIELGIGQVRMVREAGRMADRAARDGSSGSPLVVHGTRFASALITALLGSDPCPDSSDVGPEHAAGVPVWMGIGRVLGLRDAWRGDVAAARRRFEDLRRRSEDRGEPVSSSLMTLHLIELGLRCGDFASTARMIDEWARSSDSALLYTPLVSRCRALLAAGQGDFEAARRWGLITIDQVVDDDGSTWDTLEAQRAIGMAALAAGDTGEACGHLESTWNHLLREGVGELGAFPVAISLVDALVACGRIDDGAAVVDILTQRAEEQDSPWARAAAVRCEGAVAVARGADEGGVAQLVEAAVRFGGMDLRFDQAASLLEAGRALRRQRRWGRARAMLTEAQTAFDALPAPGWAALCRRELGRLSSRRPRSGTDLTPAQRDVARLAAEGLSNRQIAERLVISPKTVEAHMTRVRAILGVASRVELAARLKDPPHRA